MDIFVVLRALSQSRDREACAGFVVSCDVYLSLAAAGARVLWPWNWKLPVVPSDSAPVGGRFRLRDGPAGILRTLARS